jgi:hypothetical protein
LDEALADAEREGSDLIKRGMSADALRRGVQLFEPAYVRYLTRLMDPGLIVRLSAVNAFLVGAQVRAAAGSETIDYDLLGGLQLVVANARVALEAFRRENDLPAIGGLDGALIAELLRGGDKVDAPFEAMREWMEANPPCKEVEEYLEARRDGQ